MNIFKILANGDGTINEANISAFLGYLLNPYADHGLGFEFLERFIGKLENIKENQFIVKKFDYEIIFESAFKDSNSDKNIVDIVIICYSQKTNGKKETAAIDLITNEREVHKIFLIENKIRIRSITENQLQAQYTSTITELKKIWPEINEKELKEKIHSIYVTPQDKSNKKNKKISTDTEYENLENIYKDHLYWKDDINSIYEILKLIIADEIACTIDAIPQYTLHTIKSFIQFLANDFKSEIQVNRERKNDGSYTRNLKELNINSRIEYKLNNLRQKLIKLDPSLEHMMNDIDLSTPQDPRISIRTNDIRIEILANSISRKTIQLLYKADPTIFEKSRAKLISISNKLNIELKKQKTKDIYCRTNEMQEQIDLNEYNKIYNAIRTAIELSK